LTSSDPPPLDYQAPQPPDAPDGAQRSPWRTFAGAYAIIGPVLQIPWIVVLMMHELFASSPWHGDDRAHPQRSLLIAIFVLLWPTLTGLIAAVFALGGRDRKTKPAAWVGLIMVVAMLAVFLFLTRR